DAGWDRNSRILIEGAAVEHFDIGPAAHHSIELAGANAGRPTVVFNKFAECFAWNVYAREQYESGGVRSGDAALKIGEVGVSGIGDNSCGASRQDIVVGAENHTSRRPRHQPGEPQFKSAQRNISCPQEMILRERQLLTHID